MRKCLAVAALVAVCVTPSSLRAQNPNAADHDFSAVKVIGPNTVVGAAQLVRNNNGITCVIQTSGLIPGDVYSVWWVIPDESLVLNATGGRAGDDGTATFAGHMSTGPIPAADGSVVLSSGDGSFDQPRSDTVTVIIRHHGPPIPGSVNQQTGSFNFGCGTGGCKNVQRATFLP